MDRRQMRRLLLLRRRRRRFGKFVLASGDMDGIPLGGELMNGRIRRGRDNDVQESVL